MEILINTFKNQKSKSCFLLLALFLIGMSSCQKDATVRLPAIPSKLVIISFLSPQDTIIRVDVTWSQPLYNNAEKNKYQPVENALVTISSELGSGTLIYDPLEKLYKLDSSLLKIREGKEYSINVSTPEGKAASAITTIPSQNNTLEFSFKPDSSVKITWIDPAETVDYYRVFWQNSSYHIFEGYNQNGNFSDTIYEKYVAAQWYSDIERKDNGLMSPADELYPYYAPDTDVYLLHLSKEYYDYGIRLQQVLNVIDNPFSEPIPMYSNVKDGFGIFAGYNMVRKRTP